MTARQNLQRHRRNQKCHKLWEQRRYRKATNPFWLKQLLVPTDFTQFLKDMKELYNCCEVDNPNRLGIITDIL